MHRFPTEHAQLKVRNPSGDVTVETGDVAEATVELVPLNDTDATRSAIEKATVDARGDEIVVELAGGRGWSISIGNWGFGSAQVSVRITCPHGSDLACDTASADIRVTGKLGEARIRTASGDTSLEEVDGALELKSASGDVRVESVAGRCTLNTVSGDIELETAMAGVSANSVSGDVELGEIVGDLTVSSVSGDQSIRAAGPGDVALKAVSGDVDVAIRRGLRVRLDVNSVSGSIGSELEVSDAPTGGDGPEAGLRVRTVSGDVRISRAAGAVV
jgi:DUF4097 and DUF4098 domain-containing protein YvlB